MNNYQQKLKKLLQEIPENVKLVVVSKTRSEKEILEIYHSDYKVFGENRVQEFLTKHADLPKDIEWHFIGHLQTNKLKNIVSKTYLIHSVDSLKLAELIDVEAKKQNIYVNSLLQVHIAEEESKFGFSYEELKQVFDNKKIHDFKNLKICGLMGMATYTDDYLQVRFEFNKLSKYFSQIKSEYFRNNSEFKELSMGMSGDYKIAIDEGSTIIRIGTSIFGERVSFSTKVFNKLS